MVISALLGSDFAGGASAAAHAHEAYNVAETKQLKLKRILIAIRLLPCNDQSLDVGTGFR